MWEEHPATGNQSLQWRIRAYREADLPAIVDLINLCDRADGLNSPATLDDLRQHFATPGLSPERQVLVVQKVGSASDADTLSHLPEGAMLGFGRAFPSGATPGERVYGLMVRARPEARGHGLEETIARRLIEIVRAHEAQYAAQPAAKVRIRTYLFQQHASVIRVMEGMGLRAVREGWTMARPLDDTIERPHPIPGITIRRYEVPQDNKAALDALNASFADYFDAPPLTEERWSHEMASPSARPDLSWLAVDDTRVVGLSVCLVNDAANTQSGSPDGWIEGIGVIPQWRRRGIARSLLLHSLHSLHAAGITTALADADAGSPAAIGLFQSVGFTPRQVLLQYECELSEVIG
jgi:ribosomal protein S18 acetylase RimI-like enzyme